MSDATSRVSVIKRDASRSPSGMTRYEEALLRNVLGLSNPRPKKAGRQEETSHEVTTHALPGLAKVSARSGERPVDARSLTRVRSYDKSHNKGLFRMTTHLGSGSCGISHELNLHLGSHMTPRLLICPAEGGNVPSNWNRCLFPSRADPPTVCKRSR